ncbi:MAG: tetratricopeptide repeat protein [Myxococcales bacterium]|nr:tetratricopeptide repeat protein [Myxococcales bacterium]
MLRRNRGFNRSKLIEQAGRAHGRGRLRKAAKLYEQLLSLESGNLDLHRKAAPLLARVGRIEQARKSFEQVARAFARSDQHQQAIGVYREALHYLPRRAELWLGVAQSEAARGRPNDALQALLEGRAKLRRRPDRGAAIRLLNAARTLDPNLVEPSFDLARLLHRTGDRRGAQQLLEELGRTLPPHHFRRVRWLQLNFRPTPTAFWRMLCMLVASRSSAAST